MSPRRIGRHLQGGTEPGEEPGAELAKALREALSRWPSGVSVVAVREGGRVHALTVSAFTPVSIEPPLVLVSLGPNAAAAPFIRPGTTFAISQLGADQRGLATRYADTFPVGPAPFPEAGPPVVADALTALVCHAEEILPRGDHRLVIGRVVEVRRGRDAPALVYYGREYRALE